MANEKGASRDAPFVFRAKRFVWKGRALAGVGKNQGSQRPGIAHEMIERSRPRRTSHIVAGCQPGEGDAASRLLSRVRRRSR